MTTCSEKISQNSLQIQVPVLNGRCVKKNVIFRKRELFSSLSWFFLTHPCTWPLQYTPVLQSHDPCGHSDWVHVNILPKMKQTNKQTKNNNIYIFICITNTFHSLKRKTNVRCSNKSADSAASWCQLYKGLSEKMVWAPCHFSTDLETCRFLRLQTNTHRDTLLWFWFVSFCFFFSYIKGVLRYLW